MYQIKTCNLDIVIGKFDVTLWRKNLPIFRFFETTDYVIELNQIITKLVEDQRLRVNAQILKNKKSTSVQDDMSQFDYRQFLGLLPETPSENYFDEKRRNVKKKQRFSL